MKRIITFCFLLSAINGFAQPKAITQAIVTTKTTIVAPEEDENIPNTNPGNGGEEMRIIRFGGDGETKTTTWLKNDLVKTFSETEMGRTTTIRDNSKKMTTTIMEMMGKKMGFYASDSDQAIIRKRMDSMMQSRNPNGRQVSSDTTSVSVIHYFEETRKIAGYDCKKALIVTTRANGKSDTTTVWYAPEMKLTGIISTGGSFGGFGGFSPQAAGPSPLEGLNGFPMQYERNMNRGRKMTVVVTKLVTDKEITDKEFEIPRDIDLKSVKDMQNGPGGFQMRIGG